MPSAATVAEPRPAGATAASSVETSPNYAYAVVLWGAEPAYVLGAMVLAKSLRATGTPHDLVLLHTANVPAAALLLLQRTGWRPREVSSIQGVPQLFSGREPRFEGVFTKLHVMGLVEYTKVLLLDIDTLVVGDMDSLFELRAPAAMVRGPQDDYRHGDAIDGRTFFAGARRNNSWTQCWGINAGVMLLKPCADDLAQMLREVEDPNHPSHIAGKGPEQDYLSRYWADRWTHIGVECNFQLHQVYNALSPHKEDSARAGILLDEPPGRKVRLVHYSGRIKPWSRVLESEYAAGAGEEEATADARFLETNLRSFTGYWLWVLRDEGFLRQQGENEGVRLGDDGRLFLVEWQPNNGSEDDQIAVNTANKEVEYPTALAAAARRFVADSYDRWVAACRALGAELGLPDADAAAAAVRACTAAPLESDASPAPAPALTFEPADEDRPRGWICERGWWLDRPLVERASALSGVVPEPFVTFSVGCQAVLALRGASAHGIRAVALPVGGGLPDFAERDDLAAWADQVPAGALILMAIVDAASASVTAALAALATGIDGLPNVPAEGCRVMALAGRKGDASGFQTMAAADIALATVPFKGQVAPHACLG